MEPSESDKQTTDKSSNGSNEKAWEDFQKIDGVQQEFKKDEKGNPLYNRRTIDISVLKQIIPEGANHGLTGSHNLGNTCFMNSSIQCMSNSIDLTAYFLSKQYEKEINTSNKLGLGGRLAKAWYNLLFEFWMGSSRVGDAGEFKSTIAKRARQFAGYSQHDSHELMTFFLDTLNEDLNRATTKPYREINEQEDGEDDSTAAARFWQLHLERNDSIITDLFSGQFKTTIQCPNCKWISRTYDPFTTLSLPIPTVQGKFIYFIPKYSLHKTVKMSIKLTDYILCGDLNKLISSIKKFPYTTGKMRCIVVEEKNCVDRPNPDEKLQDVFEKGYVFCGNMDYEGDEECSVEPLYLGTEDFDELSAYPRMLTLHKTMTYDELKKIIYIYARKYITTPLDSKEFREEIEKVTDDTGYSEDTFIKMCNEEYEKLFKAKEPTEEIKKFLSDLPLQFSLKKGDDYQYIFRNEKTPLDKNSQMLTISNENDEISKIRSLLKKGYCFYLQIISLSEYSNLKNTKGFNTCCTIQGEKTTLTLDNCLETFCVTEKLGEHDKWYCKKCKKHTQAYKKMELFYLPKLLVIHLKRFESEGSLYRGYRSYDKNGAVIDFPINDFDISQFVVGPQRQGIKYDLYAVSQHFGGCGGGHYTAICKNSGKWYNYNDSSVSSASENDIVSSAAYVLFYRRKE